MLRKTLEKGDLYILHDVVKIIVKSVIEDIEEIAYIKEPIISKFSQVIKRTGEVANIHIITEDDNQVISVTATVAIKYGVKIKEICSLLQKSIKSQIDLFTGFEVNKVDIIVDHLIIDK